MIRPIPAKDRHGCIIGKWQYRPVQDIYYPVGTRIVYNPADQPKLKEGNNGH